MRKLITDGFVIFISIFASFSVENYREASLEKGVLNDAVITLGEQGALFKDSNQIIHQPAYQAGRVLETTGAGDAFNGGLAVAVAEGMPIDKVLRFACATASISVTRPGTAPSMPSRDEIEALIK